MTSSNNWDRYRHQLQLPEIGEKGLQNLKNARIAIIGCGGLGSLAATYLAVAGVGFITLIDGDKVEESNLQRQITYGGSLGQFKSLALKKFLKTLNDSITVISVEKYLTSENAHELLVHHDVILDGTDHIPSKMIINEWAKQHKIPLVYAAVRKYEGYLATFHFQNDLDLSSIYPPGTYQSDTCDSNGVFGPTVGILSLYQATEVIKLITGFAKPLLDEMLWMDFKSYMTRKIKLHQNSPSIIKKMEQGTPVKQIKPVNTVHLSKIKSNQILVSILEEYEFLGLRENVTRMPLSTFDLDELHSDNEYVFYCMSGNRSWALVDRIQRINDQLNVFSLEGGASMYIKENGD